jgi:hypothetical protein
LQPSATLGKQPCSWNRIFRGVGAPGPASVTSARLVLLHVLFLSYQLIWIVIFLTNMMNHLVFLTGGKIIKELTLFSLFWLRIS